MANILPTRKRVHSAPTAQPEPENTLAFKTGYWAGLELGEPSQLIDECCLRDQLDYRAGFNCGQREVARALEDYKILQARERAAMRRIEASEKRKKARGKGAVRRRNKDYHDYVPDKIFRKRDKTLDDTAVAG